MRKRRSRISRQNTSQRHFGAPRGAVLFVVALKYYGELFPMAAISLETGGRKYGTIWHDMIFRARRELGA